jgi:hypothetical protein
MERTTLSALLLVLALAVAGCGGTDAITEEAVEDASGGEVKIDRDGDQTKIEVGGQELENRQGGLVDGFPDDFPMPGDYEVETSTKTHGKYQAFGSIPSAGEAYAFYQDELAKHGWEIEVARDSGGGVFQIIANNGGRQAVVNSSPANEGANLTVVVE